MKRPSLVSASLALNVGLLAIAAFVWRPPRTRPLSPTTAAALTSRVIRQTSARSPEDSVSAVTILAGFHWSQVASPDYETYARNLRAIGCPQRTIGDIIGGDVDDEYSRRIQALVAPLSGEFWEIIAPPVKQERLKEAIDKLEELKREKRELLQSLGRHWPGAEVTTLREDQWMQVGFLPRETQDAIQAAHDRHNRRTAELRDAGLGAEEVTRQVRQLERERDQEIAGLMSPEQFAEYTVRASPNAGVRYGYYHVEPSADELAAIVRLQDEAAAAAPPATAEQGAALAAAKLEAEAKIKDLLGPDRYADYQRANDSRYRITRLVSDRLELPVETADRLYELQVLLEAQAGKLREAASGDDVPFAVLQDRAREELGQMLDPEALEFYERHGSGWVDGLTPKKK